MSPSVLFYAGRQLSARLAVQPDTTDKLKQKSPGATGHKVRFPQGSRSIAVRRQEV